MANGYQKGDYFAKFMEQLPQMMMQQHQLKQADKRLLIQEEYLKLSKARAEETEKETQRKIYGEGLDETQEIIRDLATLDSSGESLVNYLNTDKGRARIGQYSELEGLGTWANDRALETNMIQEKLTKIQTNQDLSATDQYEATEKLYTEYPLMNSAIKGQVANMSKQYGRDSAEQLAREFLEENKQHYPSAMVSRWMYNIEKDPEKAWTEINEFNEANYLNTALRTSATISAELSDPLSGAYRTDEDTELLRDEQELIKGMLAPYLEKEKTPEEIAAEKVAADKAAARSTLNDEALKQLAKDNPDLFVFDKETNEIVGIEEGQEGIVGASMRSLVKKMGEPEEPKSIWEETTEKMAMAGPSGKRTVDYPSYKLKKDIPEIYKDEKKRKRVVTELRMGVRDYNNKISKADTIIAQIDVAMQKLSGPALESAQKQKQKYIQQKQVFENKLKEMQADLDYIKKPTPKISAK